MENKNKISNGVKKILLIEDEMRLHKVFEELFKKHGFELFSAYDGVSGLNLAEEKSPDLILLDIILPKKDGFQVLKEISSSPRLSGIPVIVFTNLEDAQDIERASSLGARAYLIKTNYSVEEIIKKIKEII